MTIELKKAIISDKIYFHKDDILNFTLEEVLYNHFSYTMGDGSIKAIYTEYEGDRFGVPSGSFHKFKFNELIDERPTFKDIDISTIIEPFENQSEAIAKMTKGTKPYWGILQAPCGTGKTIMGIYMLAKYRRPTMIAVHTKLLAYQWVEQLKILTNGQKIGFVGDGKCDIQPITVVLYHSGINNIPKLQNNFELMIVDEVHRAIAPMFNKFINNINCRIKIGLTATPFRKDGLHVTFPDYFSSNKVTVKPGPKLPVKVLIIRTDIEFKLRDPKLDWARSLNKLCADPLYIGIVDNLIRKYSMQDKTILVLGERLEFLKQLQKLGNKRVCLIGEDKQDERDYILYNMGKLYDTVLSTKIFDEGVDCPPLDTLIATCPMNNMYLLEQRIGRIQRQFPGKEKALMVDIWLKGNIVNNQQANRMAWYQQQGFEIEEQYYV